MHVKSHKFLSHWFIVGKVHLDELPVYISTIKNGPVDAVSGKIRSFISKTDVKDNRVEELVKRIPHGDNVILFSNSGSVSLIEKDYKTVSKYGTNVVKFDSEFQFLTYHLREYSMTSRP